MSEDILKEQAEFVGELNELFQCPFCGAGEFYAYRSITGTIWTVGCDSAFCDSSWSIYRDRKEDVLKLLGRAKVAESWEEKYREKEQECRDHCDKIAALMSGGAGDR